MKRTNLKATVAVVGVMAAAAASLAWAQTAETPATPPAAGKNMPMHKMMGGMMDGGLMGMGRMPMFDFAQLDANKDGKITAEELNQQRTEKVKSLDADGNGTVSLEEYTGFMKAQRDAIAGPRDTARFQAMDADGDGQLSAAEMIVRPMQMQTRMIERMDADNDGAVSQEEFDAAKARFAERMKDWGGKGRMGGHGHHGYGMGQGMMGQGMGWFGGAADTDDDEAEGGN